jgi:hypothetical protein
MTDETRALIAELSSHRAEFLVVGGHAMAAHGWPRATGDFDIWVGGTPENAPRAFAAIVAWLGDSAGITPAMLDHPGPMFQFGVAPWRIDVLTHIDGVRFEDAWSRRMMVTVDGLELPIISRVDLEANKAATGRLKDAADLAWLRGGDEP